MATILIVDDHELNRKLVVNLLTPQGHRLLQAGDGAEALERMRSDPCDLVVTDVLMPVIDGFEFVRRVRADPNTAATRVMFYTAHYPERQALDLAEACGVDRVLTKPCPAQQFLDAVDALLRADAIPRRPLPPAFDEEHLRLVTDKLSQKTGLARLANERLVVLVAANLQLASERDPALLIAQVCNAARSLVGATLAAAAAGAAPDAQARHFAVSSADPRAALAVERPLLAAGIPGAVMRERRPRRLARQDAAAGLPAGYPPFRSLLCAPLTSPTRAYGWICATDRVDGGEFSETDEQLLVMLAALGGRIYENGSLYADLRQHAARLELELAQSRRHEGTT
jgi:CheY-like chemotaxis protein